LSDKLSMTKTMRKITSKLIKTSNLVLLTIPAGLSFDIDFVNNFLRVESGSGVLIKSGGAIT